MTTADRYTRVREQVNAACERCGRRGDDVVVLAVSKTVDLDQVQVAFDAGVRDFAENRPDELLRKQAAFPQATWHFIGNIQSRRIRDIVSVAYLIHSVAKESHLAKIDAAAKKADKVQRVLLEVNVSGEESKSGFTPDEVFGVVERAAHLRHLEIVGLMTMAPRGDTHAVDRTFSGLQNLRKKLDEQIKTHQLKVVLSELSMGMTEDWPQAIAYGTTIVRIGRAIFDEAFE